MKHVRPPALPRYCIAALLVTLLVTTGFGCRKPTYHPPVFQPPAVEATPTADQTSPDAVELDAIQTVLKNFSQVDSFRADMTIYTRAAITTGRIEFDRRTGMHGKLTLPGPIQAEIYLTDTALFFRSGTSSWMNLTQTPDGAKITDLMRQAFSTDPETLSAAYLSGSTRVTGVEQDASGCVLYRLESTDRAANRQTNICVAGGLPTFIENYSDNGKVEIHYDGYHQPIRMKLPR